MKNGQSPTTWCTLSWFWTPISFLLLFFEAVGILGGSSSSSTSGSATSSKPSNWGEDGATEALGRWFLLYEASSPHNPTAASGLYLVLFLLGPIDLFKVTHPASCWAQMVKEDGELILQVVMALEEMPHLCLELWRRVVEGKMKSTEPL